MAYAQPSPPHQTSGELISKPGAVTALQALLGLIAVLALCSAFTSIATVGYGPASLIGFAFFLYFAIHAAVCAVEIANGKTGAWVWTLVNTVLGLLLALLTAGWGGVELDGGGSAAVATGVALGALYATLMALLVSNSTRTWIRLHRRQPGQPAPIEVRPERPATKPASVGFLQFVLIALILPPPLVTYSVFADIRNQAAASDNSLRRELDDHPELIGILVVAVMLTLAFAIVGPVLASGLGRGSAGSRVFAAIWFATLLPLTVFLALAAVDPYLAGGVGAVGSAPLVIAAAGTSALGIALAAIGLSTMLSRRVRDWAPFEQIFISRGPADSGGWTAPSTPYPGITD